MAHPGHELRLTRWIAAARPTVFVFTSGSRSGQDRTRVEASRDLAGRLGARPGRLFGETLDREVYGWIMDGEADRFTALALRLADEIVEARLDAVVTDAWQLYNVAHDLWHLVTRTAVGLASDRLGREVALLDYAVVPESMALRSMGPAHRELRLGEDEVADKLALAAEFPAIAGDVAEVVERGGRGFLATEVLHRPRPMSELLPGPGEMPLYELFGEQRVQAGLYDSVLRWSHAAPIAAALTALTVLREEAA